MVLSRGVEPEQSVASGSAADVIFFDQLGEHLDPALLPPLDQPVVDESRLTPEQRAWRRDGVVVLHRFLPDHLIDAYIAVRKDVAPAGWLMPTPYLHVPPLRDLALYPPLMVMLQSLIGEPMMLHLALTAWVSTERNWHQDDYLNPPFVASWYVAVWMALEDIHPDSGPFEYVLGSHRWKLMRREKVRSFLTPEELSRIEPATGLNHWEKYAERFITPAVERQIRETRAPVTQFIARRGDVLIWHGSLMHRGSAPHVPGMPRRALITHYSGVNHRPDMPARLTSDAGYSYAWFDFEHK